MSIRRPFRIFTLLLCACTALAAENLLLNPDFSERDAGGGLVGWKANGPSEYRSENGVVTLFSKDGSHSTFAQSLINLDKDTPYVFECQVMSEESPTAQAYVEFIVEKGGSRSWKSFSAEVFNVNGGWLQRTVPFNVPDNVAWYFALSSTA